MMSRILILLMAFGLYMSNGLLAQNGSERAVKAVVDDSWEGKPVIDTVFLTKLIYDDNGCYTINYTAKYKGANYVFVSLKEEYNAMLRCEFFYTPSVLHGSVNSIIPSVYVWLYVKAVNDYGETVYTVEIPPYPDEIPVKDANGIETVVDDEAYDAIRVYNLHGGCMGSVKSKVDMYGWAPGIYLLKYYKGGVCLKTEKYAKW